MMLIHNVVHSIAGVYRKGCLWTLGTGESWRKTRNGMQMRIKPDDFMDQAMLFGYYEAGLVHWIENVVNTDSVVVDVGAQKGYVTLLLSKMVGNCGKVISIEPDPDAFSILSANVKHNKLNNVVLFSYLVGDNSGNCDFYLSNQLGFSSRFPNEVAAPLVSSKIVVEMITLDHLLENEKNVSFIKIDAEGSEPLVLAGMQRTLSLSSPVVWLEVNRMSLQSAVQQVESIEGLLYAYGYRIYRPTWHRDRFLRGNLSLTPIDDLYQVTAGVACFDIVAIPRHFDLFSIPKASRINVER